MAAKQKVLVLYFSYTGNTRQIAHKISEGVGGDIVELETNEQYSTDYSAVVEQAEKEVKSNYKPKLKMKIDNMDSYDVIFLGSPIWWHTIAPPLVTFLAENNLEGKKILLFTTNSGSGAAHSVKDVQKFSAKANFVDSISLDTSNGMVHSLAEVSRWLYEIVF